MGKKLDTPESKELKGLRKERTKRIGNVVKGAVVGGVAGTVLGAGLGKLSAAAYEKQRSKNPSPRSMSVKEVSKQGRNVGATVGGGFGSQLGGGFGSYKNLDRTPEQAKSDRTRIKTLRPIVRAQRKKK
jgi:hypothetical protein